MERHKDRSQRSRRDSSPDRRRKEEVRRSDNDARRIRRSRSNSPRRKDKDHGRPDNTAHRERPRASEKDTSTDSRRRDREAHINKTDPRERSGRAERDDHLQQHQDRRTGRDGDREERTRSDTRPEGPRYRKRQRDEREEDIGQYEFGEASFRPKPGTSNAQAEKDEPNYGLSGKLTAETNTYKGVVIKYNEPEEARIPKTRWRMYGFKGDETLPTLYVHRQSAYLIGRNRTIVDMPVDHPSCSGQHAVLQYRLVNYDKADGTTGRKVKPYIIDLESTNGTYVNNNRIETARYYEVKEGDMIKFGFSSREYVLLHERSKKDIVEEDEQESS